MQVNADSINWPPEFSELKRLDVILKCGICYDFMNNCMITSCSHTYCSLCIRKFMQYKNQCPTCYEETYEINLRNNRLLDEVILIYTKIRDKLLRASRLASVTVPPKYEPKDKKAESKELPQILPSSSISNSSVNNSKNEGEDQKVEKCVNNVGPSTNEESKPVLKATVVDGDSIIVNGVKVPGMFTSPKLSSTRPRRPEELTSCPVCEVKVPARNINIHLDSCLALDPAAKPKPKVRKRSPLPKRVYTMMPEKSLKKFLKDYGLNTTGDRKTMINRLQRYTVIYNAENDAVSPRPVSELIKQLEREEREEKKPNTIMKNLHAPAPRPAINKNDVEAIEKANKAYCEENRSSFQKLIEQMRAREGRNIKPLKPINRIYSDDEDDPNKIDSSLYDDCPSTSSKIIHNEGLKKTTNDGNDLDDDIFIVSDSEEKLVKGKIDWNKTLVEEENCTDGTGESFYDLKTQIPIDETNLKCKDTGDDILEKEDKLTSIDESDDDALSTDYGESSDGSVYFGTSKVQTNQADSIKKGVITRKSSRRRLSLSWKKSKNDSSTVIDEEQASSSEEEILTEKQEDIVENVSFTGINIDDKKLGDSNCIEEDEKIDKINSDPEDVEFNGFDNPTKSKKVIADASVVNGTNSFNEEDVDKCVIESPTIKRLTRSAKRKSISNQDIKNDEEDLMTSPLTRKKTKRDLLQTSPDI